MKNKYFYSHIVATEDISLALGDLDMPQEERLKLINLAHENLHHAILDHMLDQLTEEDKKDFLVHLTDEEHDKAWSLLNSKVENAEDKILKLARKMIDEMLNDISSSSK